MYTMQGCEWKLVAIVCVRIIMRFLSLVSNSFGCSASGERLVSAARDGDFQEAKALLEYNPRLVRYSTFGVRNSPLHYSAAQGHHEVYLISIHCGQVMNFEVLINVIHVFCFLCLDSFSADWVRCWYQPQELPWSGKVTLMSHWNFGSL